MHEAYLFGRMIGPGLSGLTGTKACWSILVHGSHRTASQWHGVVAPRLTGIRRSFSEQREINAACRPFPETIPGRGGRTLRKANSHCRTPLQRGSVARRYYIGTRKDEPAVTVGKSTSQYDDVSPFYRPRQDGEGDIKVIDYSAERIVKHELTQSTLPDFLQEQTKPTWASCRWVYVNGLDWDVVKCIGTNKNLHRLAIDDVMHPNTPTKVDWYNDNCFIVMTLQRLVNLRQQRHENKAAQTKSSKHPPRLLGDLNNIQSSTHSKLSRDWAKFLHRKHNVSVEQVSVFLTADNTVVTLFDRSGQEVFAPLWTRLESSQTIVRSSNDASMLVQALSDVVVDLALPVGKAFGDAFHELELDVLTSPTIAQSKQLYALRSELTLFQDIISPISSLVRMLRDHHAIPPQLSGAEKRSVELISPMTRTYLADVQDRITVLSSSIHASIRSAENLTSLMFNTLSAKQNESVRQLTLVSIFFLPLTFLTGYFGMNFDPMPIVNANSDMMFWYIAAPFMLGSLLFMVTRAAWSRSIYWMRKKRSRETAAQQRT